MLTKPCARGKVCFLTTSGGIFAKLCAIICRMYVYLECDFFCCCCGILNIGWRMVFVFLAVPPVSGCGARNISNTRVQFKLNQSKYRSAKCGQRKVSTLYWRHGSMEFTDLDLQTWWIDNLVFLEKKKQLRIMIITKTSLLFNQSATAIQQVDYKLGQRQFMDSAPRNGPHSHSSIYL